MLNRNMLMEKIMMLDFALSDITLFLDTHPDDEKALAYYQKMNLYLKEAKHEYMHQYGSLSNRDDCMEHYDYISAPWPWEGGRTCGCMKNDCSFQ